MLVGDCEDLDLVRHAKRNHHCALFLSMLIVALSLKKEEDDKEVWYKKRVCAR